LEKACQDAKLESLSIQDVAAKLSNNALPADEIKRVLHGLGFRANVADLANVLHLASELLPTIEALRPELPGFFPVIDLFRKAPELYRRTTTILVPVVQMNGLQDEAPNHSHVRSQRLFPNLHGHLGKMLNDYQERHDPSDDIETRNILLCLCWLLTNIPIDAAASTRDDWFLPKGYEIDFNVLFSLGSAAQQECQRSGSYPTNGWTDLGLFGWLEKLDDQYSIRNGFGFGRPSPFRELVSRLSAANDPKNQDKFSSPPQESKNRTVASRAVSYIDFDERYLSRNHWYYPTPTEMEKLRGLYRNLQSAQNDNLVEATILLLALITCRTVEEVLQINIAFQTSHNRSAIAGLQFRLGVGFSGNTWKLAWVIPKTQFSQVSLIVQVPERLTGALRACVEKQSRGKLIDLLPETLIDWKTRAESFGESALGCKPHRLNLLLRDAVLRAAYGQSSNRALITIFGAHRVRSDKVSRRERFALSHYLDPLGERTSTTYKDACTELLGSFGTLDAVLTNCRNKGESKLNIKHHTEIAEKYRSAIPIRTGKLEQARECHNAFAFYSLLLLMAATGHRRSKTPFYFPWDFCLEEMLIFISDKIIVGSEARFVPLADEAGQQIRHYLSHLASLQLQVRGHYPEVVRHIDSLIRIGEPTPRGLTSTSAIPIRNVGLFFTIDESGACQTLATRQLDQKLEEDGFERVCRLFRPALADALWHAGHSGMEVTALLGHANDLHPFGPASSWSVVDWADRIRPSIQNYLRTRGWQSIESPVARARHGVIPAHPELDPGDQGYEGRYREKRLARERVRQAVRAVISEEMLADKDLVIDDDAAQRINHRVKEKLSNDPKAMQQALGCLAHEIESLRARGEMVRSFKINRWSGDPSPIELTFSRHMEIAATCRRIWFQRVGTPIAGPLDSVERAAQLAISLVVAEGILNPATVFATVTAALAGCDCFPDVLILRAHITSDRSDHEFVHLAGTIVAAQILGWQRTESELPPSLKDIEKRIGLQLTKILGRKAKGAWKIKDLCLLFRPWWFVRLPGPIYAIAVGNHHGPAANETSDASLFELIEPSARSFPAWQSKVPTTTTNRSALQKEVICCLTTLRSRAAGTLDEGTQTNRSQRKRLRKLLSTELDAELAEHMRERPIVDVLVSFIGYLHDKGGVRGRLRYNSINTYLGVISEVLIIEGWDADFEVWEEEDFKKFYERVLKKCGDYRAPMLIRQFHQLLRDSLGAPYIYINGGNSNDVKSQGRSTLITRSTATKAYEYISRNSVFADQWRRPTAALLALSDGYGLRPKESLGISVDWFDSSDGEHLTIRRNIIRDLKRKDSRRVLPACLPATVMRPLRAQINSAAISPEGDRFLFGSPDRSVKLLNTRALRSNLVHALRAASGNPKVVSYDLRHTYATRLALAALSAPANLPATNRARTRIGRLGDHELVEVRRITRIPSGNPFLVDAIGKLLGHASVNTLLDTYFHGAHLVHAEYVSATNVECPLSDQQLANMIGIDRSAVTHQRKRLRGKDSVATPASIIGNDVLVRHYLTRTEPVSEARGTRERRTKEVPPEGKALEWALLDRLFCKRKLGAWSLVNLEAIAVNDHEQDQPRVQRVLAYYRDQIIGQCGFDDFEPDQSDLTHGNAPRSKGVIRAQKERQDRIEIAQDLYRTDKQFCEALHTACFAWVSYVNGDHAYFVIRTEHEFSAMIEVLSRLGANPDQLDIRYVGPSGAALYAYAAKEVTVAHIAGTRFSRGPPRIPVTEIAISVRQKAGSTIGEGRDVHRLFAMLACCLYGESSRQAS
jgi:integrase